MSREKQTITRITLRYELKPDTDGNMILTSDYDHLSNIS
jgi:hypothetical protein